MREIILEEARSWLGTPFRHAQCAKGAGVDCAMLSACVYYNVGLVPWIDPRPYPPDWALHRNEERMLNILNQYAHPVETPCAGDMAAYRFGRCVSHMAIIENDEMMIHAYVISGRVVRSERSILEARLAGYWSVF